MARKKKTMDGNTAAAHVSYAYTDVAAIYPITPSSTMAEVCDEWATQKRENVFGYPVKIAEMQSEGGAAGAVHGALLGGALTTTFTASQGLLLMIPNMYKMAGEKLPGVINVSARCIATHALSIFGDHSDVYACRQTGYAMLCENSVQEVMDLTPVAHLSALKGRVPFLNFFDGFRTSHEFQKIDTWDYEELKDMLDFKYVEEFRRRALNPNSPVLYGSAQNSDVFFQASEASNSYYDSLPDVVASYMNEVNKRIGTDYKPFNYFGAKDATHVIVAMGSVCDTIEETVQKMVEEGEKVGVVKVRLYRPFSQKYFVDALPDSVKRISVLDRTKEAGSIGEPLFLDVLAALRGTKFENSLVFGGRYGLACKDTTPTQIKAVFDNKEKARFTIGIEDDVTFLSLKEGEHFETSDEKTKSCKFWGLGSDGTVGANKNSVKIIGDNTDMFVQAYFAYDSKKSGGITVSHLRFGEKPIKSSYLISKADFVACHNASYIKKYDIVQDIKKGGIFLLNCSWDLKQLEKELPAKVKTYIANNDINFYTIDGVKLGKEIGLGGRINTILQSAFFKLSNIMPIETAKKLMKEAAYKSYSKKGESIVNMNYKAIDLGADSVVKIEIPQSWKTASDSIKDDLAVGENKDLVSYVNTILKPVNDQKGDKLPVSAFIKYVGGYVPQGSAAYEKRGVATEVPCWDKENCIQCNICSFVCPHAVIRPSVLTEEEEKNAPGSQKTAPMIGCQDKKFAVDISVLDCTGCGVCVSVCPGKAGKKALSLKPLSTQLEEQECFSYSQSLPKKQDVISKFSENTLKGSQFKKPLLEFSGACAGCGETPYAKLVTQLFGDRMYIANATGCSSIWGGSSPATPYTTDENGFGPAWANSLFEDNAEFGFGINLAQKSLRERLIKQVEEISNSSTGEAKDAAEKFLETKDNSKENKVASENLVEVLTKEGIGKEIILNKAYLNKKSVWIFGGDGWAYDIGYGGLDHVLASREDVNVLIFDTEVYSNTGGQASKSTPTGAIAKFAAGGKGVKKKDIASIFISYGYVYVAQVSIGANYNQCLKALIEAENYNGPSLVICYAPCINHGLKGGMSGSIAEEKKAVDSGYWNLFRFNPALEGNKLQIDSGSPTSSYEEFLMGEVRYSSLVKKDQEKAKELFKKSEEEANNKRDYLTKLEELYK